MRACLPGRLAILLAAVTGLGLAANRVDAQRERPAIPASPRADLTEALSPNEWQRVDRGITRALEWLASNQRPDGSFPARPQGQPAITSLGVLAFLSAGHQPGRGQHGERIDRAVDFVLECQQPGGLFSYVEPEVFHVHQGASHAAAYNHAIAGLMLCEVYGQVAPQRSARIEKAVEQALKVTLRLQSDPPKTDRLDVGGWRYLREFSGSSSDLSVTGWQLMFLRSARNAQFDVPERNIGAAVNYVESLFQPDEEGFYYGHIGSNDRYTSRGMMGVGVLSLALAGKHNTPMARSVGDALLRIPFDRYGATNHQYDRFHYSAYYCSNAMAQLGGDHWKEFFPVLATTLLDAQSPDGCWVSESGEDYIYGSAYPTALSVLTLTPAHQLLPIYQR